MTIWHWLKRCLLLAGLFGALPALSQGGKLDCANRDDRARCAAELLSKRLALYELPPIDDAGFKGGEVYRAFIIDGYGRDMLSVVARRLPGQEPRIIVRFSGARPSPVATERIEAVLPLAAWPNLVREGALFDRALAPEPDEERDICLHGWSTMVEANAPESGIRRAYGEACARDLAYRFAVRLAEAAVNADPACALIDPEQTRNDTTRLVDCRMLGGDRAAAAQALNVMRSDWLLSPRGADFARAIAHHFTEDVVLNWPGEAPVRGNVAAARVWAGHGEDGRFESRLIFGETADRVRVEGVILMTPSEHEWPPREARVVMIWERNNGFDFRLTRLTSDAAPPPPPDDH